MAVLANNLTTIALPDDTLLHEAFPGLDAYLPNGQSDWSMQRTLGQKLALKRFREVAGQDPQWCEAVDNAEWELVLTAFSLQAIFQAFLPSERWLLKTKEVEAMAEGLLKDFQFRLDEDQDGEIADTGEEAIVGRIRTINLLR